MSKAVFDVVRSIVGRGLTQDEVDRLNAAMTIGQSDSHSKVTSERGKSLIRDFEGERLTAYPDPATGGEPWTIGVGHTGGVKRGDTITKAQSDAFLSADLKRFENAVNRLAPKTTQNQFDALVSFAFNLGEGNLSSSTLLKMHNAGDYAGAAKQFVRWNKAAGKVMAGLTRRREAEAALYAS